MMLGRYWSGLISTTPAFGGGVERGVWVVVVGLAHCWVLKHQALHASGGWWFWFLPLPWCARVGVVGGWWGCCLRSA